ncbi:MAG: TRAP transporter large permease subunit, partial [Proteobacteria bacterium]|nr:TRAP transporter large permease subunit [Pseudomonadota bacterium]
LGILIPPSIMLVVMGNLLSVSIGTLFLAALLPGLLLAGLYVIYIVGYSALRPSHAPPVSEADMKIPLAEIGKLALKSFVPPFALIFLVLGSIFAGWATPTEASGIGAFGATVLAAVKGKLSIKTLWAVVKSTALIGAMLFGIFVGATAFSFVFALLGGHDLIVSGIGSFAVGPWSTLIAIMVIVFILGFFFDWIQIALIVLPVFAPIMKLLDFGGHVPYEGLTVIWFAILVSVNLQTSFLTPPFGFALFYLKGAAPKAVKIQHIYKGVIPFVILQVIGLTAVIIWPEIALWLPHYFGL